MVTPKKTLVVTVMLILATTLISWDYLSHSKTGSDISASPGAEIPDLIFDNESGGVPGTDQVPGAEDVLVKKIPGDNNHLLVMAFYSKENFAAPSFSIENGSTIELRDDGKGYDEKAGDGLYTARITTDVTAFRKQAISMLQKMKDNGYKPFRYIHRELVYDPDAAESFDTEKFDASQPVSISGLTNALALGTSQKHNPLDTVGPNCMVITNLGVVEDSTRTWNSCTQKGNVNGSWTFGTLMRQLASKSPTQIATDAEVSDFVKNWLNIWLSRQVINGDTVFARSLVNNKILNPWLNKSADAGAPAGQLDMRFTPFKLTAIVNRFDLRAGNKFGLPSRPCGQARFIFCLIKEDCSEASKMTMIFEYGINKSNSCSDKMAWAQQWFNLKDMKLGSSAYNQALQAITDQFTLCGTNSNRPNQSSLDRIRTNEIAFASDPKSWELREFLLNDNGKLKEATLGQTPADKYDAQVANADVQRMVDYVNKNKGAINGGTNTVPGIWEDFTFLGGSSHILGSPTGDPPNAFHWDGTDSTNKPTFIVNNDARSNFSLSTCNGCHGGETQTGFNHIDPVFFGTEATLSGFLSGKAGKDGAIDFDNDSTNRVMAVKDPSLRPSPLNPSIRKFNEIGRRGSDLSAFVATTCGSILGISAQLMFQPVNMVH